MLTQVTDFWFSSKRENNQKQVILVFASCGEKYVLFSLKQSIAAFLFHLSFFLKQNKRHELVKQSVIIDGILLLFHTSLIRTLILDWKTHVQIPPPPGPNLNDIPKGSSGFPSKGKYQTYAY